MNTGTPRLTAAAGFMWLFISGVVFSAPENGAIRTPLASGHEPSFVRAVRQLQTNHPALSASRAGTEAARARTRSVQVLPDPTVSAGRFVEPVQTRTGPQESVFNLEQSFPWFGTLDERSATAGAEADRMEKLEDRLGMDLVRALADAFYEYAYIGEASRLTRENLRLLLDLEPIVATKVAAGENVNALLRLKVESGRLSDQLRSLGATRVGLSSTLNALLNEPDMALRSWPQLTTTTTTNALDLAVLSDALDDHNVTLAVEDRHIAVLKGRERLARLDGYPTISLGVNYIQIGDPEVNPTTPNAGEDAWGVRAKIHVPLWRGAEKAKRAEAIELARAGAFQREDLASRLHAELRQRVARHADAVRRLGVYGDELLGLARQAVENSRAGYENGQATVLELIDSERSLLALELEYWRALADAHIHRIHIISLTRPDLDAFLTPLEAP